MATNIALFTGNLIPIPTYLRGIEYINRTQRKPKHWAQTRVVFQIKVIKATVTMELGRPKAILAQRVTGNNKNPLTIIRFLRYNKR
jgi:hypothetical protein